MTKEIDLKKLAQQVQMLQTELDHHISRQSLAHDLASEANSGFMSSEQFKRNEGMRIFFDLKENAIKDIYDIPTGFWLINIDNDDLSVVNLPEKYTGWWLVDCHSSEKGRKDFILTHSFLNKTYLKTFHTDKTGQAGWKIINDPRTINLAINNATGFIYADTIEFGLSRLVTLHLEFKKTKEETEIISTLPEYLTPKHSFVELCFPWENRNDNNATGFIGISSTTGQISVNLKEGAINKNIQKKITFIVNKLI